MQFLRFAVVSALTLGVTAAPHPINHVVHERRESVPKAWVKRSRMEPTASLPVRIGMTQSNMDNAHELLMEVYVPPCTIKMD